MEKIIIKNTVAIIIPYFGKFPNYFQFWLESCRYNPTVDWFIFTDDNDKYDFPINVHVLYLSFNDIVLMIQQQFEFKINIPSPYKLCDFKPTYGIVFSQYIKDFRFWGFGDMDLIYGDIRSFLTEEILERHDKILIHGPFCLMKNENENNNVFRKEINGKLKYKEVYSDIRHIGFDEYGAEAFNSICEKEELSIYKNQLLFADINSWKKHFLLTFVRKVCSKREVEILEDEVSEINNSSIFVFNKGKLTRKYIRFGELKEQEYMYVHFQKRKMASELKEVKDKFVIIPNKFVLFVENIDIDYLQKFGKKSFFSNRRIKRQLRVIIRMFVKKNFGI